MGVLLGSAVVPIALCTTWSKANKWGCIVGAIAGLVAGIIAWMVTTAKLNPVIDVKTTGGDYEMLAGNLAAIGVGGIISVVSSYLVSRLSTFSRCLSLTIFRLFLCSTPRTSTSTLPAPLIPMSTITLRRALMLLLLLLVLLPTRKGPVPQARRSLRKKQARRPTHILLPRARCKLVSPVPKNLIPSH